MTETNILFGAPGRGAMQCFVSAALGEMYLMYLAMGTECTRDRGTAASRCRAHTAAELGRPV